MKKQLMVLIKEEELIAYDIKPRDEDTGDDDEDDEDGGRRAGPCCPCRPPRGRWGVSYREG